MAEEADGKEAVAPSRIWLQYPEGDETLGEGPTWSANRIDDSDTEYVRSEYLDSCAKGCLDAGIENPEGLAELKRAIVAHADAPIGSLKHIETRGAIWKAMSACLRSGETEG